MKQLREYCVIESCIVVDCGAESLAHLGAEYALKTGTWEISPQLAVDFVGGDEVLVFGVVFGKGF
jgi:hypothetical protein